MDRSSAWIAGNPVDVLATNFNKPESLIRSFPCKAVFISPNQ
jgi:oxalate decarboxylase